ncbi:TetR/AcrR family transcriptional regulator [Chitinimonas taiwanensis]|uniref:TetR/AcrR family transcriptional regulator n=1 Tax=Chitinimonas taiwanensis TaxID=240412 RepID=UPI0035AE9017
MADTTDSLRPRRGRPRDPQRMQRLLEAARVHFLAHGYERASLDAIARESGVSKMTIYSYFPSKRALFEAVISARTEQAFARSKAAPPDPAQPAEGLRSIAGQFLALLRHDSVLRHFRLMHALADEQHEACLTFFQQGPERTIARVADYLTAVDAIGALRIPNPRLAADLFLSMLLGENHIRLQLGLPALPDAYAAAQLEEAVQLLLCRYAPPQPG